MDDHSEDMQLMANYGFSQRVISDCLQKMYPGSRGLSERSVRRFFKQNKIHKPSQSRVNEIVGESIGQVR